jgi:hypothetical protein
VSSEVAGHYGRAGLVEGILAAAEAGKDIDS